MADTLTPQLPPGDPSLFSTLSQSLLFHSSPELFISSRACPNHSQSSSTAALAASKPASKSAINPAFLPIIHARILNRNVAIVSSHRLCQAVLRAGKGDVTNHEKSPIRAAEEGEEISPTTFTAASAYDQLMSEFFPPPNLLLLDGRDHETARERWHAQLAAFPSDLSPIIRDHVADFISRWNNGDSVNLYESMKTLSWRVLLSTFLNLNASLEPKAFSEIENLQETLLRGQFSLFPASVNLGLWRSPRSKGIAARRKLQSLITLKISSLDAGCLLKRQNQVNEDELASNVLLFTSSIAIKALASLLTASLLNVFIQPTEPSLADRIRAEGPDNGPRLLESILLETERLSPPVVGVMRRAMQDVVFASSAPGEKHPTLVPAGWDVWLYFAGAGRDGTVYQMADSFVPERFVAPCETKPGFGFGGGSKTCLGQGLVREIVKVVINVLLDAGIRLDGQVTAEGVRGWLGWESDVPIQAIARDLKQLPCQRPKEPIYVRVKRNTP